MGYNTGKGKGKTTDAALRIWNMKLENENWLEDETTGESSNRISLEDFRQHAHGHAVVSISKMKAKVEEIDLGFLLEEIPNAIKHTTDGIEWVTKIVHSMKAFSHPGETGMTRVKLNKSIESALDVSRNEYKYVADIELDLADDLPLVTCLDGEQRKSANYPQLLL